MTHCGQPRAWQASTDLLRARNIVLYYITNLGHAMILSSEKNNHKPVQPAAYHMLK